MDEYIASDLYRLCSSVSVGKFLSQYMKSPTFRYLVAFRKMQKGELPASCSGLLGRGAPWRSA